jgi:succinate dehydrogenase / fumarate reductase cytochrome b subunit
MSNFWFKYKFRDIPWVQYHVELATGDVISKTAIATTDRLIPYDFLSTDETGRTIQNIVVRDLYQVVQLAFQQTWLVVLYLIGMIALAYHLVHGFQSAFQSLGWRHKIYTPIIRGVGIWIFGIIIPLLFAAMPVYFFFL